MLCYLFPEPSYLFFSADLPGLLYYSHIPATVIALIVGFFVFWNGRQFLLNRLLFTISIFFSLWTLLNLISWTNIHSDIILFSWSFFGLLSGLLSVFSIYFIYVFLEKKDVSIRIKIIFLLLLAPIFLLAPTSLNLKGFNLTTCDAFQFENVAFYSYYTLLGVLAMLWILILLVHRYRRATPDTKKQIKLMGIGIESFLFFFFTIIFLASYFVKIGVLPNSELELYGFYGMIIFITLIATLIVRFKTFNVGLIASQALVMALVVLIGAQFTFVRSFTNIILNSIALVLTGVIGILLIRSVKREVEQREHLQTLTTQLEISNEKLKILDKQKDEFLSFASHDLKSPIALIKQFATLVYDGTYKDPAKIHETVLKIKNTADRSVNMVNTFLDLRKIEEGRMEYNFEKKNIVEFVSGITSDFTLLAKQQKNIDVSFSSTTPDIQVNMDTNTLRQVIQNFLDNSMKYTEAGWIKVQAIEEQKTVLIKVSDSGLGMDKELLPILFGQFHRDPGVAKKIQGTGLGLYIAKQIVLAHHGDTWAESEGKGKGSQFYIRLPKA